MYAVTRRVLDPFYVQEWFALFLYYAGQATSITYASVVITKGVGFPTFAVFCVVTSVLHNAMELYVKFNSRSDVAIW